MGLKVRPISPPRRSRQSSPTIDPSPSETLRRKRDGSLRSTAASSESHARLLPIVSNQLRRAMHTAAVKALISAQIIAGVILLIRAAGWLQPLELLVYDELRVA
jgi:hypothetical protein